MFATNSRTTNVLTDASLVLIESRRHPQWQFGLHSDFGRQLKPVAVSDCEHDVVSHYMSKLLLRYDKGVMPIQKY